MKAQSAQQTQHSDRYRQQLPQLTPTRLIREKKWQKHLQLFQEFFQELTARGSPDLQSLWRGLEVLRWFRRNWRRVSSRVGDTGLDFVAGPGLGVAPAGWAGGVWWELGCGAKDGGVLCHPHYDWDKHQTQEAS